MLAIAVLLCLVLGVGAWLFLRSERGQKVIGVVQEGISMARDAAAAPGTDALRAAGCSQAMVMSSMRIFDLVDEIATNQDPADKNERKDQTYILCRFNAAEGEGPGCADMARVYAGAVPEPPPRLAVIVQSTRGGRARCQGVYAPDGSFIEPFDRSDRPDSSSPSEQPPGPAETERSEPLERP
jgi:hypothetical protein